MGWGGLRMTQTLHPQRQYVLRRQFSDRATALAERAKKNVNCPSLIDEHSRSARDRRIFYIVTAFFNNDCSLEKTGDYLKSLNRGDIGYSKKSVQVALLSDYGQELLREWRKKVQEQTILNVEYKLRKLKKILDICVPENAIDKRELDVNGALGAIAEANKMCGDYAPVKSESKISTDSDTEEAKALMQEIKEQLKKEF